MVRLGEGGVGGDGGSGDTLNSHPDVIMAVQTSTTVTLDGFSDSLVAMELGHRNRETILSVHI